jgi:hypothetical protein
MSKGPREAIGVGADKDAGEGLMDATSNDKFDIDSDFSTCGLGARTPATIRRGARRNMPYTIIPNGLLLQTAP